MKKFDYYYAKAVGKMLTGSECLLKAVMPTKSRGLVKQLNVPYGDSKSQKLDIFYNPESNNEKRPILFYIHGGGFISGTKALRRTYCTLMAKQGYYVVNIGYRLAPETHFPNQLNDIFKAIEHVLTNNDEIVLDDKQIVIAGESAGAYFASYIAAITKNKSLYEQNNIDFRLKNEFEVGATVLINGAYSISEILQVKAPFCKTYVKAFFDLKNADLKKEEIIKKEIFSPLNFIKNDFPKTIVIRGKYDIFDIGTRTLLKILDAEKAEYSLYTTKGIAGLHAFSIIPISKDAVSAQQFTIDKLEQYLQENVEM